MILNGYKRKIEDQDEFLQQFQFERDMARKVVEDLQGQRNGCMAKEKTAEKKFLVAAKVINGLSDEVRMLKDELTRVTTQKIFYRSALRAYQMS